MKENFCASFFSCFQKLPAQTRTEYLGCCIALSEKHSRRGSTALGRRADAREGPTMELSRALTQNKLLGF